MDEVKQINPYEFVINGWCFNFLRMRATRIADEPCNGYGLWCVNLVYIPEMGCVSSADRVLQPPTTSNHGTWDWSKYYSFFTPPEDRYNKLINDAYQTYLLERAIKEAL